MDTQHIYGRKKTIAILALVILVQVSLTMFLLIPVKNVLVPSDTQKVNSKVSIRTITFQNATAKVPVNTYESPAKVSLSYGIGDFLDFPYVKVVEAYELSIEMIKKGAYNYFKQMYTEPIEFSIDLNEEFIKARIERCEYDPSTFQYFISLRGSGSQIPLKTIWNKENNIVSTVIPSLFFNRKNELDFYYSQVYLTAKPTRYLLGCGTDALVTYEEDVIDVKQFFYKFEVKPVVPPIMGYTPDYQVTLQMKTDLTPIEVRIRHAGNFQELSLIDYDQLNAPNKAMEYRENMIMLKIIGEDETVTNKYIEKLEDRELLYIESTKEYMTNIRIFVDNPHKIEDEKQVIIIETTVSEYNIEIGRKHVMDIANSLEFY